MSPQLWLLFPISIACDVIGQICFKLGAIASARGAASPMARALPAKLPGKAWIGLGVAIYAIETFVWLKILSLAPLSLAFPIAAMNFLGVTLAGRYLFKEPVGVWQWLGVALVTLGVIAVAAT